MSEKCLKEYPILTQHKNCPPGLLPPDSSQAAQMAHRETAAASADWNIYTHVYYNNMDLTVCVTSWECSQIAVFEKLALSVTKKPGTFRRTELGLNCSKLTMSLVNVSLKLWSLNIAQTLIFLLKQMWVVFANAHFFQQKYLYISYCTY